MIPLTVVCVPTRPGTGRPRVSGTVLATPDGARYVAVRCAFSSGEDTGSTGSPRVEVWVALAEANYAPLVVRGSGWRGVPMEWAAIEAWHEIGEIRQPDVLDALRRATHSTSVVDVLFGPQDDPPTTIWDRRVILPDDARFPRSKYPLRGRLRELLARRNFCSDEEVASIDCEIMNLAPRGAGIRGT